MRVVRTMIDKIPSEARESRTVEKGLLKGRDLTVDILRVMFVVYPNDRNIHRIARDRQR